MKAKRLLKTVGLSLAVLGLLFFVAVFLMESSGSLLNGGTDSFLTGIQTASIPLLVFRLGVYVLIAAIGYRTWALYKKKEDVVGMDRLKRMMICFAIVITVIELPGLF